MSRTAATFALALAAVVTACGEDAPPQRPSGVAPGGTPGRLATRPSPPVVATPAAPRCGAPNAAGARVVVDVSQSMQGFTAGGSVNLEKLHRAVDLALGEAGVATPLRRCTLGDELDCETPHTHPQYNSPTLYTAGNCRLDRAVRVPPVVDPRNPPVDNLDPYRAVVLLTDGMQSATGAAGAGNDPVAACQSGADPNCLRLLLRDRIRHGYGVWIATVLLPFRGTHFAEQGLDRATFESIRAHVTDAAQRLPYSREAFPPPRRRRRDPVATLQVGREFRTDDHGLSSFPFEGWKPMLAVVASCDTQLGDRLIERLRQQLVNQQLFAEGDRRFFAIRVAPMAGQPLQFGAMQRVGDAVGRVDVGRPARGPAGLVQRVVCDTDGRATLRVPYARGGRAFAVPAFVGEPINLSFDGRTLSPDALSLPRADAGAFLLSLRCERLPAGIHRETMVLSSSLSLGEIPGDSWWREFTAPNSFSMPERVYGLQGLVEGLLEAGVDRRFRWDSFTIEIERQ